MIGRHPSENVRVVAALAMPFIGVFGIYVIAHGHYGPGGGFAGGVVLAVGVVLARLTIDPELVDRVFPPIVGALALVVGMSVFLLSALVPMLFGGQLLDYAAVDVGDLTDSRRRYLGIMIVEFGVGAVVFGGILSIFDRLATQVRR
ncbi:MAG TPA: MnhB domain-containing protein [Ilumatobacteraceae bacterium]|nr:MnhB domain-containing protein [Ilumatobacteraceae bacterium]